MSRRKIAVICADVQSFRDWAKKNENLAGSMRTEHSYVSENAFQFMTPDVLQLHDPETFVELENAQSLENLEQIRELAIAHLEQKYQLTEHELSYLERG